MVAEAIGEAAEAREAYRRAARRSVHDRRGVAPARRPDADRRRPCRRVALYDLVLDVVDQDAGTQIYFPSSVPSFGQRCSTCATTEASPGCSPPTSSVSMASTAPRIGAVRPCSGQRCRGNPLRPRQLGVPDERCVRCSSAWRRRRRTRPARTRAVGRPVDRLGDPQRSRRAGGSPRRTRTGAGASLLAIGARPDYPLAPWNLGVLESSSGLPGFLAGQGWLAEAARLDRGFRRAPMEFRIDETIFRVELRRGQSLRFPELPSPAGLAAAAFASVARPSDRSPPRAGLVSPGTRGSDVAHQAGIGREEAPPPLRRTAVAQEPRRLGIAWSAWFVWLPACRARPRHRLRRLPVGTGRHCGRVACRGRHRYPRAGDPPGRAPRGESWRRHARAAGAVGRRTHIIGIWALISSPDRPVSGRGARRDHPRPAYGWPRSPGSASPTASPRELLTRCGGSSRCAASLARHHPAHGGGLAHGAQQTAGRVATRGPAARDGGLRVRDRCRFDRPRHRRCVTVSITLGYSTTNGSGTGAPSKMMPRTSMTQPCSRSSVTSKIAIAPRSRPTQRRTSGGSPMDVRSANVPVRPRLSQVPVVGDPPGCPVTCGPSSAVASALYVSPSRVVDRAFEARIAHRHRLLPRPFAAPGEDSSIVPTSRVSSVGLRTSGPQAIVPVNSTGGCGALAWMAPPMARRSATPEASLWARLAGDGVKPGPC